MQRYRWREYENGCVTRTPVQQFPQVLVDRDRATRKRTREASPARTRVPTEPETGCSCSSKGVVLVSGTAGIQTKVYWLDNPRSQWPVPSDLTSADSDRGPDVDETIRTLNGLTTFTLLPVGTLLGMVVFDRMNDLPITDGILEVTMNGDVLPMLAFLSPGVVFHVALQTSHHVENDDTGWPPIRRLSKQVPG